MIYGNKVHFNFMHVDILDVPQVENGNSPSEAVEVVMEEDFYPDLPTFSFESSEIDGKFNQHLSGK